MTKYMFLWVTESNVINKIQVKNRFSEETFDHCVVLQFLQIDIFKCNSSVQNVQTVVFYTLLINSLSGWTLCLN